MISPELEKVLHRCFVSARQSRHRIITVDHLVLELLSQPSVITHLTDKAMDIQALRSAVLAKVASTEVAMADEPEFNTLPTQEFQRIVYKAIRVAQEKGRAEVSAVDMLAVALNAGA